MHKQESFPENKIRKNIRKLEILTDYFIPARRHDLEINNKKRKKKRKKKK